MPLAATRMDLEIMIPRRSQTDKADRIHCHSRVGIKHGTNEQRQTQDGENNLWLPRGKRLGKGGTGELAISRGKPVCIGSYQHLRTLLFSTGPHATPMRSHDGKGLEKNTQVTRALCCQSNQNTVDQLYFNIQ